MARPIPRALGIIAVPLALASVPTAGAAADPVIVYSAQPAAGVLHDGVGTSMRQSPSLPDRRWRRSHVLAKVRGKSLATAPSARAMAAMLRRARRAEGSAFVGVDEILPGHWTTQQARRLETAVLSLGPEADRVVFYAGPSMVEQIGRRDPRRHLGPTQQALVNAMARGRSTYLMTYRGNLQPFPERAMATYPSRWIARWPGATDQLGVMIGPDAGLGQRTVWNRVRSTAAGRRLLGHGVAAYGLRGAEQAREWLREYRDFLDSPDLAPQGVDARVPEPGGLALSKLRPGVIGVHIARPGRAVVRLVPRGERRGRVIKAMWAPVAGTRGVRLPRDVRPGRYAVVAVLDGEGLRDTARMPLRIRTSG